ncbi:MAG TPA: HlyD family efflux transporter periplasmic adaptor subunit [Bacteroidales bacterium]|nr:HlyD family efflux transporter periplasmic adaptor subunit [Bacteroidales bacterium]
MMRKITMLLCIALLLFSCNKKETVEVPVSKAVKGTFYLDVIETGEIQAIKSINVTSPNISWRYGTLKITQIVKDGKEVEEGDTLLVFDPSEVKKAIVEAEARLEMSYAELEKMKAQQQSDLEEQRADYEVTRLSQEISKIQFESATYEANIKRKEIQLNLDKANIALARAKEQINNQIKIQAEDVKQKMLSIEQDKTRLKEAHETLERLFLASPAPGIAIINRNWSSDVKFQVGDQCWSGQNLIQLPNLKQLKATVQINEVDISKITKGLKVEIKPDAFSDSVYYGEVMSVANLAVNKEGSTKIKVFPVDILIHEGGKKLLPGLSVSCRMLVRKINNVVFIPIDGVQTNGLEEYVYLKTKNGFEKRVVETGVSNTDHIIITKGLKAGDVVAMADPFAVKETKGSKDTKTTQKEVK